MPRLSSKLPGYRKHASGQAFVYLDGRNIYLGPYGTQRSRQEYDRLISEWTANGRRLPSINGGTSVAELCAAYLKHAKAYYPGKTLQTRILNALRLLNKLYGRKPADHFGPLGLKAIRQVMVETGVSRRYVNDTTAELKRIFKWGASEELVSHDVFHKLQTVSGLAKGRTEAREPDPICPVTDDDINKTLEHLTPIVQSMVRLQRLTGIRPDELCSMRPTDIDRTGNVWVYRPPHHKTQYRGRLREVAIGPRAQEVLMPYLLRAPALYCFVPAESVEQWRRVKRQARKTAVQPSQVDRSKRNPKRNPGKRYDTASYRRAIHRACIKAGVPQWSPNQLRHSMATEVRRVLGLEAAQVALGHSRADVTQVYAEKNLELAAKVAQQLG